MIDVHERVEVLSAPQTVWDLLTDPHAVVNCVPGATLGDQHEDGSFDGSLTVRFGPAKVTFHTRVSLEVDDATKVGHVTARGKDNQGGTRVRATMTFKVIEQIEAPGTSILIEAQVEISGRLALVVEAGASIVVKRMTREFSEQLAARYAGPVAGEATAQ
ncbi:MAG: SRPBCC domain-containing protein [Burkholderiales bacterium]